MRPVSPESAGRHQGTDRKPITVLSGIVLIFAAGCNTSSNIPTTQSTPSDVLGTLSNLACAAQSGTVTVSGTMTSTGWTQTANGPSDSYYVVAVMNGANGNDVGSGDSTLETVQPGQSQNFDFSVVGGNAVSSSGALGSWLRSTRSSTVGAPGNEDSLKIRGRNNELRVTLAPRLGALGRGGRLLRESVGWVEQQSGCGPVAE